MMLIPLGSSEECARARAYEAISRADPVSVGALSEFPPHVENGVCEDVLKCVPRSPTSQRLDLGDVRYSPAHVLKSLLICLVVGHQLEFGSLSPSPPRWLLPVRGS